MNCARCGESGHRASFHGACNVCGSKACFVKNHSIKERVKAWLMSLEMNTEIAMICGGCVGLALGVCVLLFWSLL